MNAAQSPARISNPALVAEWAAYEAASRQASLQYILMPIALNAPHAAWPCNTCGRRTVSYSGTCRKCQKAGL